MISRISYGDKLDSYVENENLIPYRLHKNARYRTNSYYWIDYEGKWCKVEEVEYNFDTPVPMLDHVQIVWMDKLQAYLCTDLTMYDFRLEKDKYNIRNRKKIVNVNESFAGGEIEYWMFKNHITFLNKTYQHFWPYISPNGKSRIDSNKYYFIKAEEKIEDGVVIYTNVKFICDNSRTKFKNQEKHITYIMKNNEIDRKEILKERSRRQRLHERKNKKSDSSNGQC